MAVVFERLPSTFGSPGMAALHYWIFFAIASWDHRAFIPDAGLHPRHHRPQFVIVGTSLPARTLIRQGGRTIIPEIRVVEYPN
jgi:hypothetical protein